MATIKSYTDIEQSKKLAEILPLESADMSYISYGNIITLCPYNEMINYGFYEDEVIPCWSSTALLEVIRNNGRYELQMYEGGYYFEANGFMTESYFNPVDACVELIIKLNELNML